nr:hypothetical protein [Neoroseomonas alba]
MRIADPVPQRAEPVHDLLAASGNDLEALLMVLARRELEAFRRKPPQLRQVRIVRVAGASLGIEMGVGKLAA